MAHEFKIPANLVPKVWASKVWTEGNKASYFDKFTAADGSKPIQQNKDLSSAKGDTVYFGLAMNLKGDGIEGTNTLKGNEDELTMYDFGVKTNLVRNAVKRFVSDDQNSPYDNLKVVKQALVQWLADWKDDQFIAKLTATPTVGEYLTAASAGTEASTTVADKLTCALISKARRKAMLHAPKIKPINIDGSEKYIMLVSPLAARDLKSDQTWINANQYAGMRGSNNPIFSGALGEFDGVVLYEYERVQTTKTGASSANVCHNLLLGQQAACFAVAKDAYRIKDVDDYGNVEGNGIAFNGAIAKTVYNSHDYGVLQVMTGGADD